MLKLTGYFLSWVRSEMVEYLTSLSGGSSYIVVVIWYSTECDVDHLVVVLRFVKECELCPGVGYGLISNWGYTVSI